MMPFKNFKLVEKIKPYHFELRHVMVLFIILMGFQVLVSLVHKVSLQNFLLRTQKWYLQDAAERLANLTTTSLELVVETTMQQKPLTPEDARKIIQAFNIIFSQQTLQQHVEEVCIIFSPEDQFVVIDDGHVLYNYLFNHQAFLPPSEKSHLKALELYQQLHTEIKANERIYSILEGEQTFHVFVPFVPRGEYIGTVYMKNKPNFSFITREIISSYNEASLIFMALILFGLLAMFYISSNTVKERDEARQLLYQEREKQLMEQINHQKETLFTKRIYHTHHKAEKVMGFIKEDLRTLSSQNMEEVKYRVAKYANFIARVIYDMKWYDPPIHTIRNPIFRTDVNEVLKFIIDHIFLRVANKARMLRYELDLDPNFPPVSINEFVVWEIVEPLLQNSLEHAGEQDIIVTVKTEYLPAQKFCRITIRDNGKGIAPDLLLPNADGVKKIFQENTSTKSDAQNAGYGCYLAYEIARQRCGWTLDAENLSAGGCQFVITIPNPNLES